MRNCSGPDLFGDLYYFESSGERKGGERGRDRSGNSTGKGRRNERKEGDVHTCGGIVHVTQDFRKVRGVVQVKTVE